MSARLDAHFHLWDPRTQAHDWLRQLPALDRRFGIDDFEAAAARTGVRQGVLVQAIATAQETHDLLAIAAESDAVAGVVGWVELERDDVAAQIAELRAARGGERLVGLRHLVQSEPDPRWLARDAVGRGLAAIADADLVYDILVRPAQLEAAIRAVAEHPRLRFVLDHAGKPMIAEGSLEPWASQVAELATHENVACKVSGLVTEAASGWRSATFAPYVKHLCTCFGARRLMFGSDWPVCTLVASYERVFDIARSTLADALGRAELEAVFSANARTHYRLGAAAGA